MSSVTGPATAFGSADLSNCERELIHLPGERPNLLNATGVVGRAAVRHVHTRHVHAGTYHLREHICRIGRRAKGADNFRAMPGWRFHGAWPMPAS